LKCYFGEFILRLKVEIFIFIIINISSWEKIKWIWLKRRISQDDVDTRKISLLRIKPVYIKNREALILIETATESIPQLILQIYIFQKKNDIFNVFSSPLILYDSPQIRSIFTSTFSIISGLISTYGYKAFYFYEKNRRFLDEMVIPLEKGLFQKLGKFSSLMIWYFSIAISRILLISLILSIKPYLIILLIVFTFIKSLILNRLFIL
jgi:hypothetical protein